MTISRKYWLRVGWTVAVVATFGLAGCDFLDPTEVNNPATTDEDLAQAEQPTAALLPGLRAQFARALDPVDPEVISDNYEIRGTGINKILDEPRRVTPDLIGARAYGNLQELRSLADFVIDVIAAEDTTATPEQLQEARYYRGMAYLLLGERFSAVPLEVDGTPVASAQLYQLAITELQAAQGLASGTDFTTAARAALARAYRMAGDANAAETEADAVLTADPEYAFAQNYDPATVTNGPFLFLYTRTIKEMQPLPRLDFLDPKYTARQAPIYVSKAEEMHLILAEIAFSRSDWATGREQIALAIEVARARSSEPFDDNDPRLNDDLTFRPRHDTIVVRADADSPFRAGLMLTRPGVVNTPTVAGTSLDADSIRAIAPTETESLLHAMFLARQEMLMLEGRRMTDLGIRMPIQQDEIETNPNINPGDPGTVAVVPAYIPAQGQMDLFAPRTPYDDPPNLQDPGGTLDLLNTNEITILFDMNRILAQQKVSPFGLP